MSEEEQPSNLVILDDVRAAAVPQREIVVALDPALYAFLPERRRRLRRRGSTNIRFVPADHVPTGLVPDLVLAGYTPTALGHRLLCQTVDHLYEIDRAHRVFKDGEILWSEPLSAIGAPRSWLPGQFVMGEEGALLFTSREQDGWHFRVFVTPDPVLVYALPALRRPRALLRDWLGAALEALPAAKAAS